MFAKIPGLDQHLAVEARKTNDPPMLRPPKLICGTVRQYDPEEASEAAFRCDGKNRFIYLVPGRDARESRKGIGAAAENGAWSDGIILREV